MSGRVNVTDEDLQLAAALVCEAMLSALPDPWDCSHVFSAEFENKMDGLISKDRKRRKVRTIMHRIAAAALAVVIGLSAWLTVDQKARAAVVQWILDVYKSSVLYHFTGETLSSELPVYRPGWLPDGYEEVAVAGTETSQTLVYQKGEDAFTLTYHWMSEDRIGELLGINGEVFIVSVGKNYGRYYPASDPGSTNDLVWMDERANIVFAISAFLDMEDILHIAESVELSKTPK